ncbi:MULTISPECIES: hypothetical protein [Bradyrhizobium]|uniref:hypothetical protein n=1 Tax=Bradyrhizobium TaxID=374 RepID=UPI00115F8627|nr:MULTISPECIES: hypothetical protein [Bradyrhizobium]
MFDFFASGQSCRAPWGSYAAIPNQNLENNPMQSSKAIPALSHPAKNILTRRANQRHYSIIAQVANRP